MSKVLDFIKKLLVLLLKIFYVGSLFVFSIWLLKLLYFSDGSADASAAAGAGGTSSFAGATRASSAAATSASTFIAICDIFVKPSSLQSNKSGRIASGTSALAIRSHT